MSTSQNPQPGTATDARSRKEILIGGHDEPITIETTRRKPVPFNHDEARLITAQIRTTSLRLWLLVVEAHDRQAHIALGYETWADYVVAELHMSESRSYQLLDTGHVMKELAAAGADVENMDPPPARVVARIKDRLPDIRRTARDALRKKEDVDVAIRALAREPRRRGEGAAVPVGDSGGAEPSTAAGGPEPPDEGSGGPEEELVKCPACVGTGRTSKTLASLVRDLMRSLKK